MKTIAEILDWMESFPEDHFFTSAERRRFYGIENQYSAFADHAGPNDFPIARLHTRIQTLRTAIAKHTAKRISA